MPLAVALVLLADNRLAIVDLQAGVLEGIVNLREAPAAERLFVGHRMALSSDGTSLFALTSGGDGNADVLAVVDTLSMSILARWPLEASVFFQGLAVGEVSRHVYVFGQRDEDELVVLALDPSDGSVARTWSHDYADGRSWRVLQGSVSDDEQLLYVSYHGADTTGVDWFRLDDALSRCEVTRERPNVGCIPGHGSFSCSAEGCLVATGSAAIYDYRRAETGGVAEAPSLDTLLGGNDHVMEFTVPHEDQRLFALGSCGYTGGLSAVDLATGEADVLSREVCGERLVLGPESTLLVAQLPRPVPSLASGAGSALLVVDVSTGEILQEIALPAHSVDLVVTEG